MTMAKYAHPLEKVKRADINARKGVQKPPDTNSQVAAGKG